MTPEEVAREVAQRIKEADEDAILAAEAFAFGMHEEFILHRQADIARRIRERYGDGNTGAGSGGETS